MVEYDIRIYGIVVYEGCKKCVKQRESVLTEDLKRSNAKNECNNKVLGLLKPAAVNIYILLGDNQRKGNVNDYHKQAKKIRGL